jgi:hypothetical protein
MTGLPTTILATTFTLSSSYSITVTDDSRTGSASVSINPAAATRYFRVFAAAAGDATASTALDETTAVDFLDHLERRLNVITGGLWTVALDTDGRVKITYNGDGTPNGAITWSSTVIKNILGFTSNISGLTTGASAKATYQPSWCFFANSRASDTNWRRIPVPAALVDMGDGSTYGFIGNNRRLERSFDCLGHPRTSALQASTDVWITPIESDNTSRALNVPASASDTTATPPWDFWTWLDTSAGIMLGACLGTLQGCIAGTTTTYDQVNLTAKAHEADTAPIQANHDGKDTIKGIFLSLVARSVTL